MAVDASSTGGALHAPIKLDLKLKLKQLIKCAGLVVPPVLADDWPASCLCKVSYHPTTPLWASWGRLGFFIKYGYGLLVYSSEARTPAAMHC